MVYNALLGRSQLGQFMPIPNYHYMVMKLPRPNGVIRVCGSMEYAVEWDRQSYDLGTHSWIC
jgi:hypothetical protein